jgi:hypothetical protein
VSVPIDSKAAVPQGWEVIEERISQREIALALTSLAELIERLNSSTLRNDVRGAYERIASLVPLTPPGADAGL